MRKQINGEEVVYSLDYEGVGVQTKDGFQFYLKFNGNEIYVEPMKMWDGIFYNYKSDNSYESWRYDILSIGQEPELIELPPNTKKI